MRVLSKAFGRLKLTLPWVPPDTKLSKLDTLRLATSYISHLQRVLDEEEGEEKTEMDLNAPVSKMDLVSSLHQKSLRCEP
jgi:musculin (activated B-cell factor-1)